MASQKGDTYGFYQLAPRLQEQRWHDGLQEILERLTRSFHGTGVAVFFTALILGQAEILQVLSPLGPAFYVAVRKRSPQYAWSAAAGLLSGAVFGGQWQMVFAWSLLGALAAGWRSEPVSLKRLQDYTQYGVPILTVMLVSMTVSEMAGELTANAFVLAVTNAILATGASFILWDVPDVFVQGRGDQRPVVMGWGVLLLSAGIMTGLAGFELGLFLPGKAWLHFCLLGSAWVLGPTLGVTAAVALSALAALGGIVEIGWMSAAVFACLVAGCFRTWGKPAVLLVYAAGISLLSLPFAVEAGRAEWLSLAAALLAFAAMPAEWLFQPLCAAGRWMRRNDLWQSEIDGKSPEFTLAGGYDLIRRLEDFAGVFRQIAFSFQQTTAASPAVETERPEMAPLIEQVSVLACRGCPAFSVCWKQEFFHTYQAMAEQFARIEDEEAPRQSGFRPNRRVLCHRPAEVGRAVYYLHRLNQAHASWEKKLNDARYLVAGQLSGIAKMLEEMAHEEANWTQRNFGGNLNREPFLDYDLSVAKLPKHGSIVSGDSHGTRESKGQLMMLLSDGMGVGTRAAMESSATLSLFEKMIDLGFPIDTTIRLINTILLFRSAEEVFATLDLAVFNLYTGEAQFMKIGAVASFIKRGGRVAAIRSQSLPLGILNTVDVDRIDEQLEPGDTVVMISDGLLEIRKDLDEKESWVQQFLTDCPEMEPHRLAERLLEEASAYAPAGDRDDMTVMVARFTRNHYV